MGLVLPAKGGDQMADKLHLKVFLNHSVDLGGRRIIKKKIAGTHLGGESGYYTVVYDGPIADGLEVLSNCLSACPSGKFYADFGA